MPATVRSFFARRSLAGFLTLTLGATLVLSIGAPVFQADDYSVVIAGLAALLFCWAASTSTQRPRRRLIRLTIVLTVFAANLALNAWSLQLFLSTTGDPLSYAEALRFVLHPGFSSWLPVWLDGLVAGLILSCVFSPSDGLRDLALALVEWRPRRTTVLAFVVLVLPWAVALASIAGARHAPVRHGAVMPSHTAHANAVANLATLLVASTPLVFAWFGFAAPRLARRLPPLVVGALIGVFLELPGLVATVRTVAAHETPRRPVVIDELPALAFTVGLSIAVLWLMRRTPRSLLPALALTTTAWTAHRVAYYFAGSTFEMASRSSDIYCWTVAAVALLLVFQGHMWRRTESPPTTDTSPGAVGDGESALGGILAQG